MRKILVPIDFSDCANNALDYTIFLAKKMYNAESPLESFDQQIVLEIRGEGD